MSTTEQPKERGEGWTLWAAQEATIARQRRDKWLLGAGAAGVLALMTLYVMHQNGRIDYLSVNRQMFCENTGTGLYRSTTTRPKAMIERFAREYLQNLKQFSPTSIEANFGRAMAMMAPEVAASSKPLLEEQRDQARRQLLSQWFEVMTESIEESPDGYTYSATGRIGGYTGTTPIKPSNVTVSVRMRKVPPTEGRPEGLMVVESRG